MHKSALLATTLLASLASACATVPETEETAVVSIPQATSVFAQPSPLPFHAPQLDRVADSEWQGIIEEAIAIERAEVEAIAANSAAPTFDNTIVALERSGQVMDRATAAFDQLVSANTNDTLNEADAALSPQRAALDSAIYLNPALFARVKAVYDNRAAMSMT